MAPLSALCERSDFKLVHLNSRSHNGEIVQLQSALNDDYNNFQEKSNTNHISEPIIGRFFPRPCACTFTSEQFHSFIQLRKETLQHFARFWRLIRSVMWSRSILVPFYLGVSLSFFLFLDFITTSDCVFNNKNNCVLRHTGYQIIINNHLGHIQHALVVRKFACSHARLWRWGWRNFFLKIAHLSFSMGPRGPRAYGLLPRLWLLLLYQVLPCHRRARA